MKIGNAERKISNAGHDIKRKIGNFKRKIGNAGHDIKRKIGNAGHDIKRKIGSAGNSERRLAKFNVDKKKEISHISQSNPSSSNSFW